MNKFLKWVTVVVVAAIIVAIAAWEYQAKASSITYTVQQGDTWESIASANSLTLQQLVDLNQPTKGTLLTVGTVNATTTTGSNPFCSNFGHEPTPYNWTNISNELTNAKASGISCLRLAYMGTNSSVTEGLATYIQTWAKQNNYHFSIIIGNDGTPNLTSYAQGVVAEAKWAQANGDIAGVSVGNEDSKTQQTQSILSTITCQVKAVYSGSISYETYENTSGFDDIVAWQKNMGCLDKLGLNEYGGYQYNLATAQKAIADLGASHVYISETNCDMGTNSHGQPNVPSCYNSDASHAAEVQSDAVQLLKLNIPIYFFAWSSGGDGTAFNWGLFNGSTDALQQPLTAQVLGIVKVI